MPDVFWFLPACAVIAVAVVWLLMPREQERHDEALRAVDGLSLTPSDTEGRT